jgi:hypothetical protein
MLNTKEKAKELVEKYFDYSWTTYNTRKIITQSMTKEAAKYCALILVENEYKSLREQLFNLKSCGVIQSDTVYLKRIEMLIEEENQLKTEIENL